MDYSATSHKIFCKLQDIEHHTSMAPRGWVIIIMVTSLSFPVLLLPGQILFAQYLQTCCLLPCLYPVVLRSKCCHAETPSLVLKAVVTFGIIRWKAPLPVKQKLLPHLTENLLCWPFCFLYFVSLTYTSWASGLRSIYMYVTYWSLF